MHTIIATAFAQHGWIASIVAPAFDPQWNLDHSGLIWVLVLGLLFLSGVGLPLPEDIPLSITGFTTIKQCHDQFVFSAYLQSFAMVTAAILAGDLVAYWMGRKYGFGLRHRVKFLRRALTDARIDKVQRWFDSYGSFTVFLGRQVAGIRFVTFFTSGTMRMPLWKFISFDFLGCVVSVPVWLLLGTLASRYGAVWLHDIAGRVALGFVLGAVLVFVLFVLLVKLRETKAQRVEG